MVEIPNCVPEVICGDPAVWSDGDDCHWLDPSIYVTGVPVCYLGVAVVHGRTETTDLVGCAILIECYDVSLVGLYRGDCPTDSSEENPSLVLMSTVCCEVR